MQSIKINDKEIYYIDSDDPVISYLKNGQLFGYGNWATLNELILYIEPNFYQNINTLLLE